MRVAKCMRVWGSEVVREGSLEKEGGRVTGERGTFFFERSKGTGRLRERKNTIYEQRA
jgi:hypothetical protein